MDNYVFWLDITVDNALRVNLVDCLTNLLHYRCNFHLSQWLHQFEVVQELSTRSHLKQNINIDLIIEKAVHFNYVGMVQKHLYF